MILQHISMVNFKILVIFDERGKGLKDFMLNVQAKMDEPRLVNFTFVILDKATIYTWTTSPSNEVATGKYHIIISMLGTNDLLNRHLNGHISPKYYDVGNLVDTLTDKQQASKVYLKAYCDHAVVSHDTASL